MSTQLSAYILDRIVKKGSTRPGNPSSVPLEAARLQRDAARSDSGRPVESDLIKAGFDRERRKVSPWPDATVYPNFKAPSAAGRHGT